MKTHSIKKVLFEEVNTLVSSMFLILLWAPLQPSYAQSTGGQTVSVKMFDVAGDELDQVNRKGRKGVIFYDMYAPVYKLLGAVDGRPRLTGERQILPDDVFIVPPLPEHSAYAGGLMLYAAKIPDAFIQQVVDRLSMKVTLYPLCENYDRLGSAALNLVDKGTVFPREPYVWSFDKNPKHPHHGKTFRDKMPGIMPDDYRRSHRKRVLEIARWVTPFMDRNESPNAFTLEFKLNHIGRLLGDSEIRRRYDFWLEFRQEGVPYDANKKVAGCANNNDVWKGYIELVTTKRPHAVQPHRRVLHVMKAFEKWDNKHHTDEKGSTIKKVIFSTEKPIKNAYLYVITSNHGAAKGGEEYVRREHFVYLNDKLIHEYIPGGKSCEPFRHLNTQVNGIYTKKPMNDWVLWNNWCPGDKIPTREIFLYDLPKGRHAFEVVVPQAEFKGGGNFPISMYLIGQEGAIEKKNAEVLQLGSHTDALTVSPTPATDRLILRMEPMNTGSLVLTLRSLLGNTVWERTIRKTSAVCEESVDLSGLAPGVYMLEANADGQRWQQKIVKLKP